MENVNLIKQLESLESGNSEIAVKLYNMETGSKVSKITERELAWLKVSMAMQLLDNYNNELEAFEG